MAAAMTEKPTKSALPASSNWAALKKSIGASDGPRGVKRKRGSIPATSAEVRENAKPKEAESFPRGSYAQAARSAPKHPIITTTEPITKRPKTTVEEMRSLVLGTLSKSQTPEQGKYLALDCEMVGVGPSGSQSSLARVSVVNYHGAVLLDKYVRQVEKVTDYRTRWSGIRPRDLEGAEGFGEVQKEVAQMMEGRVVVGHALGNDMQALLLSHPHQYTRDTQNYAELRKIAKSKKPALRKLIQLELGLDIQAGEHDSVTDARASMALFRLHKDTWDRSVPSSYHLPASLSKKPKPTPSKAEEDGDEREPAAPGTKRGRDGGRKGVSSGLSVVTRVRGRNGKEGKTIGGKGGRHGEDKEGGGAVLVGGGGGAWWETLEGDEPLRGKRRQRG